MQRFNHNGGYINVIEEENGLKIVLEPEGREFIIEQREREQSPVNIFQDLFEHIRCNSQLDFIRPEEIDALTSAPIIGLEVDRGEHGDEIKTTGRIFWHERYAVECPLDILLEKGEFILPVAPKS